MLLLGDVAEFKRGRGPDKRPRRRRRDAFREAGIATTTVGGGAGLGGYGANKGADLAYEKGLGIGYREARKSNRVLRTITPQNLPGQKRIAKVARRVAEGVSKRVLKQKSFNLDRSSRLALKVLSRPGRAGAIVGAALGAGAYGAYRGGRYGVRKLRGR